VHVLFPPEPTGGRDDASLLAAWGDLVKRWHSEHAAAGVSELGTMVDVQRMRQAARVLRLAKLGKLHNGGHAPLPDCWVRRWDERPEWMRGDFVQNPGGRLTVAGPTR
jgi:hypothetical protein